MEGDLKIVEYDKYCNSCKDKDSPECTDPCNSCLSEPANIDSHKPVKYIFKED